MDSFALTVFLKACAENQQGNVFLSPFSIAAAFSLLHPAAGGDTATELNQIVGVPTAAEALQYWQSLVPRLHADRTAPVQFQLANGVWVNDRCTLRSEYKKAVLSLESVVNPSNFAEKFEEIRGEINKWVEARTNDRIHDLIPEGTLDTRTLAVLVNALYFNGKWANKFNKAATFPAGAFFVSADQSVETPLMFTKAKFLHSGKSALAHYLQLPYEGNRFVMELFVPKAVDGIAALLDAMQKQPVEVLAELRGGARTEEVEVYLPKFKVEAGGDITQLLKKCGLERTFGDQPDLGLMFDKEEPIKVSNCFHKVFMQVDEEGTEAAAATALVLTRCAMIPRDPIVVRVDRPSVLMLTDKETKNMMFVGLLRNPK